MQIKENLNLIIIVKHFIILTLTILVMNNIHHTYNPGKKLMEQGKEIAQKWKGPKKLISVSR